MKRSQRNFLNQRVVLSALFCVAFGTSVQARQPASGGSAAPPLSEGDLVSAKPSDAGDCSNWIEDPKFEIYNNLGEIGILDSGTPLPQRQTLFAAREKCAQSGDWEYQYFVGTLYFMGPDLPNSFVPKDLNKARLYLSNAAAHGKSLAMAKMAETELASKNYLAAMVWAQILGHYRSVFPASQQVSEGYLAGLLARIDEHFDNKQLSEVVNDLNSFIANYDTQIRNSLEITASSIAESQQDLRETSKREVSAPGSMPGQSSLLASNWGPPPQSGFAEYIVAFKPDGSVTRTWLLDAVPDPKLGKYMQPVVHNVRISPAAPGDDRLRYGLIPVIFDNRRYTLRKQSH